MKTKVISLLLSLFLVLPLFSSCKAEKRTEYSFLYFDTVTTVIAYGESEKEFKENTEKIFSELGRYHKAFDIYKTYNGINNLATVNENEETEVDKEIIDLILFSKELYEKTNGKLNIALGSVLSLWHYERARAESDPSSAALPEKDALKKASEHTGIDKISVNSEKGTVLRLDPDLKIDVGGVGKGFAVERVAEFMEKEGMEGYLLNVGGNIRTVGSKNGGKWDVAIENPDRESSEPYIEYLSVEDMSVVTSGVYQRYFTVEGKNYHHIIDPETLYPSENYLSLTVVTKDSGVADALSTALFNMELEEGKEILKNFPETYVLWVLTGGEKVYSDGFERLIKK